MPDELTVVIPTLNEKENIIPLVQRLHAALEGICWDVIFVDDSNDGTSNVIETLQKNDPKIQLIKRIGRRGLSSACIEGMSKSQAQYIAVMDGDLQHDESLLRDMFSILSGNSTDIVIGSRYVQSASVGPWAIFRVVLSRFVTHLVKIFFKVTIKDPMSGFFMMKGEVFTQVAPQLSGKGQKILLDICLASRNPLRLKELPYHFRSRVYGKSKLNGRVLWDNMLLIAHRPIKLFHASKR